MSGLAVLYLARPAHGEGAVAGFAAAYNRHPAEVAHDLVVILKGFDPHPAARRPYLRHLDGMAYTTVEVPDVRFDLGAYLTAAADLRHELVCCLNSYSEPLADGWLGRLMAAAGRPGIGAAGATASYESSLTSWQENVADPTQQVPRLLHPLVRRLPASVARGLSRRVLPQPRPHRQFPRFPNPHLRTTGFVIRRRLLLDLRPGPLADKWDARRLESGRDGMTRQLRRRGLRAVVVGRDGRTYEEADWPRSRTFRSCDQENLLIGDNHTRYFAAAPPAERAWLAGLAWGPVAAEECSR